MSNTVMDIVQELKELNVSIKDLNVCMKSIAESLCALRIQARKRKN